MSRLRRKQAPSGVRAAQPAKADKRSQLETRSQPMADQQQAVGNQAVQRLLESQAVQAKLSVAPPDDAYEQEADRVADEVVGKPGQAGAAHTAEAPAAVHRLSESVHRAPEKDEKKKEGGKGEAQKEPPKSDKGGGGKDKGAKGGGGKDKGDKGGGGKEKKEEPKKKEDEKVKRKAAIMDDEKEKEDEPVERFAENEAVPEVTPELERDLDRLAAGGQPLSEELRSLLEPRFGRDLGDVRIHLDAEAAGAAHELEAQAFTRGQHVFFGAGYFEPHTAEGRWLMAHELTHTLQQKDSASEQKGSMTRSALLSARREEDDEFPITADIDQDQE